MAVIFHLNSFFAMINLVSVKRGELLWMNFHLYN